MTKPTTPHDRLKDIADQIVQYFGNYLASDDEQALARSIADELRSYAVSERKAIGLFWQTADGRWHFSPGSTNRGDIHDNGRPIHIALLGEEAAK